MPLSFLRASILLAAAVCVPVAGETGAQPAQRPGLRNFGVVNGQLYRGGQPETAGFAELKKLGIDIVVNLRHEPGEITRERALVEAQGMRYVSIPWRGKQDPEHGTGRGVPGADSRQRGSEGVRPLRARRGTHRRDGGVLPHQPRPVDARSGARRDGDLRLPRFAVRALEALRTRVPRAAAARSLAEKRRINGGES